MTPDNTFEATLERLQTYESYAQTRTGEESEKHLIPLDSNENYFCDPDLIRRMAEEAAQCDLRSYPREELLELRQMLGAWLNVDPESVVISNGGDQLIDLAATILLRGGAAVTAVPTYSLYRLRVETAGGQLIEAALRNNFSLDVSRILSAANRADASIIFLCSPNNPTGNSISEADITQIVKQYAGLVFLDEAYVEFAQRSVVPLVADYPNLAVIRTFSKAFGIAGARLGYLIANPRLSKVIAEKVQLPYPVSQFSARLGVRCLRNISAMEQSVSRLKRERGWLISRLRQIDDLTVFESETNFVLISTNRKSNVVSAKLRSLGVSVKNIGDIFQLRGCLRVTVGTRPMNEKLLDAIERVMSNESL